MNKRAWVSKRCKTFKTLVPFSEGEKVHRKDYGTPSAH